MRDLYESLNLNFVFDVCAFYLLFVSLTLKMLASFPNLAGIRYEFKLLSVAFSFSRLLIFLKVILLPILDLVVYGSLESFISLPERLTLGRPRRELERAVRLPTRLNGELLYSFLIFYSINLDCGLLRLVVTLF